MRSNRSREAASPAPARLLLRVAALAAAVLAACGAPPSPAPVSRSRPSGSPAGPSPPGLVPSKVHPSPPSVRWQVTLAEVSLARYRAEWPVASPALTRDGALVVGAAGALVELGTDGQVRWRHETMPRGRAVSPLVAGDGTVCGLSTFGAFVLLDRQGRQITGLGGMGGEADLVGNPAEGHDGRLYVPGVHRAVGLLFSTGGAARRGCAGSTPGGAGTVSRWGPTRPCTPPPTTARCARCARTAPSAGASPWTAGRARRRPSAPTARSTWATRADTSGRCRPKGGSSGRTRRAAPWSPRR